MNEQIERHRALLSKADNRAEGAEGDQEDEEEKVSACRVTKVVWDTYFVDFKMRGTFSK